MFHPLVFYLLVFLRNSYGFGGGDAQTRGRIRAQRIYGAVPLGLQENAKGGEQGTQLADRSNKCPLFSNAFFCEPRGSQAP